MKFILYTLRLKTAICATGPMPNILRVEPLDRSTQPLPTKLSEINVSLDTKRDRIFPR